MAGRRVASVVVVCFALVGAAFGEPQPSREDFVRALMQQSRVVDDVRFQLPVEIYRLFLIEQAGRGQPVPVAFIIERGIYGVALDANSQPTMHVELSVRVLDPPRCREIPILSTALAWDAVTVNSKPSPLAAKAGWLALMPDKPGVYELTATAKLGRQWADQARVALDSPRSVRTAAKFDAEGAWHISAAGSTGLTASGATRTASAPAEAGTHVELAIPPTDRIDIAWTHPVKLPPRPPQFEVTGAIAWNIDAGRQQVSARMNVRFLGGPADRLALSIPANAVRCAIIGPDVREMRVSAGSAEVFLRGKVTGQTRLNVSYELPTGTAGQGTGAVKPLPVPRLAEGHWSGGTLVVTNTAGASELIADNVRSLREIYEGDIPADARAILAGKPVLAYEITARDFDASVEVLDLGEFALRESIADLAHYQVLFRPDGSIMCKVDYEIRNRTSQFLRVRMPAGARVLSARVNDVPAALTPLAGEAGVSLLPLVRSKASVKGLVSFPVQIVLLYRAAALARRGLADVPLPTIDLPIAYGWCDLYAPEGMAVSQWSGPMRSVERLSSETAIASLGYGAGELAEGYREDKRIKIVTAPKPAPKPEPAKSPTAGWFGMKFGPDTEHKPTPKPAPKPEPGKPTVEARLGAKFGPPMTQRAQQYFNALGGLNRPTTQPAGGQSRMFGLPTVVTAPQPVTVPPPPKLTPTGSGRGGDSAGDYVDTDGGGIPDPQSGNDPVTINGTYPGSGGTLLLGGQKAGQSLLARNYYNAGKGYYEEGRYEQAAESLRNVERMARGSVEADNAKRLLANIDVVQGKAKGKAASQQEKALGRQVQTENAGQNVALEQRQQELIEQGGKALKGGKFGEAQAAYKAAEGLGGQLLAKGAGKGEQDARLRQSRKELAQLEERQSSQADQLRTQYEVFKSSGDLNKALAVGNTLKDFTTEGEEKKALTGELEKLAIASVRRPVRVDSVEMMAKAEDVPAPDKPGSGMPLTNVLDHSGSMTTVPQTGSLFARNGGHGDTQDAFTEGPSRGSADTKEATNQLKRLEDRLQKRTETETTNAPTGQPAPAGGQRGGLRETWDLSERDYRQAPGRQTPQPGRADGLAVQGGSSGPGIYDDTTSRSRRTADDAMTKEKLMDNFVRLVQDEIDRQSNQAGAQPNAGAKTLVYDVRDLLVPVPDFEGPRIELRQAAQASPGAGGTGGGGGGQSTFADKAGGGQGIFGDEGSGGGGTGIFADNSDSDAHRRKMTPKEKAMENLVALMRNSIDRESWADPDAGPTDGTPGFVQIENGALVVTQSPQNQRVLAELLEKLREARTPPDRRGAAPAPAGTAADAAVLDKLKRQIVRLSFQDIDLEVVLTFFQEYSSDANIRVNWDAMRQAGIEQTTKVSAEYRNITVKRALELVLRDVSGVGAAAGPESEVQYVIDGGVLTISTRADLAKGTVRRVYDVSDLVAAVPDFEGPRIGRTEETKARKVATLAAQAQGPDDIRQADIPWYEYIRYPRNWKQLTESRKEFQARAAGETDIGAALREKLKRQIERLSFADIDFRDVITFLREYSDINIHVNWRALTMAGIEQTTKVSLDLRNITVKRALELVLRDVSGAGAAAGPESELRYVVDGGVLTISTKADLAREPIRRIYDVRDLVDLAMEGDLLPGDGSDAVLRLREMVRDKAMGEIVSLIRNAIDRESWADPTTGPTAGTPGFVQAMSGLLVVTQTPENHQALAELLEKVRKALAAQRRPTEAPTAAPTEPDADAAVRDKLTRKIERFSFTDIDLSDVITFLREYSDANLYVNWRALTQAGIEPTTKVSVDVREITVKGALDLVLRKVSGSGPAAGRETELRWVIEDGVLIISTRADLARDREPIRRVYDVRDLLARVQDFGGPGAELAQGGFGFAGQGIFTMQHVSAARRQAERANETLLENLFALIRKTIDPESWADPSSGPTAGTPGYVQALNGLLVIAQSAENQQAVAELIENLRQAKAAQYRPAAAGARGAGSTGGGQGAVARQPAAPAQPSAQPAQPDAGVVTRTYDVRDLAIASDGKQTADDINRRAEDLAAKARAAIGSPDGRGGRVDVDNGRLVVTAAPGGQWSAQQLLARFREIRGPQVEISSNISGQQARGLVKTGAGTAVNTGGTFLGDTQVDFLVAATAGGASEASKAQFEAFIRKNYDWQISGTDTWTGASIPAAGGSVWGVPGGVQAVEQNLATKLASNIGQSTIVNSRNIAVTPAEASQLGIEFQQGVNSLRYATVDEAQLRTLRQLAGRQDEPASAVAANPRLQNTIVGTEALLAGGQRAYVARALEGSNTFDIAGNPIDLSHEKYILLDAGGYVTAAKASQMQHWTQQVKQEDVGFADVPQELNVPHVGNLVRFEKTLIRPTDRLTIRAEYTWKGAVK